MNNDISPLIKEKAALILAEIQKASSILLHCHPSPDPDSVGSALAMKFVLEGMGKKATVIKGDSMIPQAFMHFPGADLIEQKSLAEVDLKQFDLFIIQDSSAPGQISRMPTPIFPLPVRTIVIDHHVSGQGYGNIDLIVPEYPATAQILFDLFKQWNVSLSIDMAQDLFIALYGDTGGFKYKGTTVHTYEIATELVKKIGDTSELIEKVDYSNTPEFISFEALALNSVELFLGGKMAISSVSLDMLNSKGITETEARPSAISSHLRTVSEWEIVACAVEVEPNMTRFSFRSHDPDIYDVSKLTAALGGGGHKAAAGLNLPMPLTEAKKKVVEKAKELYNL